MTWKPFQSLMKKWALRVQKRLDMFTGKPSSFIQASAKRGRALKSNLESRAKRRAILRGFPTEPHALSLSEIRDYFAGDRLTCLLCGKDYEQLGNHLRLIHSYTCDDYRLRYGLPWSRSLIGTGLKAVLRDELLENKRPGMQPPSADDPSRFANSKKSRPRQPFWAELYKEIGLKNVGKWAGDKHYRRKNNPISGSGAR